jgi:gamma-tubulin complex component 2
MAYIFELCCIQVNNVDDVLVCHSDFLDNCLKDCMLTDPALLRTVNKLMAVCVQFCHFIQVIHNI